MVEGLAADSRVQVPPGLHNAFDVVVWRQQGWITTEVMIDLLSELPPPPTAAADKFSRGWFDEMLPVHRDAKTQLAVDQCLRTRAITPEEFREVCARRFCP